MLLIKKQQISKVQELTQHYNERTANLSIKEILFHSFSNKCSCIGNDGHRLNKEPKPYENNIKWYLLSHLLELWSHHDFQTVRFYLVSSLIGELIRETHYICRKQYLWISNWCCHSLPFHSPNQGCTLPPLFSLRVLGWQRVTQQPNPGPWHWLTFPQQVSPKRPINQRCPAQFLNWTIKFSLPTLSL